MVNLTLPKNGVVEHIPEVTFGVKPTNPAMLWPGLTQNFKALIKSENEEYRTLKAAAATNKLQIEGAILLGQAIEVDWQYILQDWTLLKYLQSVTGGNTPTDNLASFTLGLISPDATPKYATIQGLKFSSGEIEIPEKGKAITNLKGLAAHVPVTSNNPWSATDYKGTGTHAAKASTAPVKWNDITACTYGGANIPNSQLGTIKIGIDNKCEGVLDAYSTNSTKIAAIEPTERNYKLSVVLKKKAIDAIADKAVEYTAGNFVLTIGGVTLTFANARIPEEIIEFAPKGLTSLEVPFNGITDLTFS